MRSHARCALARPLALWAAAPRAAPRDVHANHAPRRRRHRTGDRSAGVGRRPLRASHRADPDAAHGERGAAARLSDPHEPASAHRPERAAGDRNPRSVPPWGAVAPLRERRRRSLLRRRRAADGDSLGRHVVVPALARPESPAVHRDVGRDRPGAGGDTNCPALRLAGADAAHREGRSARLISARGRSSGRPRSARARSRNTR